MTVPKFILTISLSLFIIIGIIGFYKKTGKKETLITPKTVTEVTIKSRSLDKTEAASLPSNNTANKTVLNQPKAAVDTQNLSVSNQLNKSNETVDLIDLFFTTDETKLPIVETITYTSRVPWLKGRPAWVADYAAHYGTTRHFIARSLNKKVDYFTQNVAHGDKFNVLKKDLNFHLLVDLSSARLWFYALDTAKNERYLIKTYQVGLGRKDSSKASGCLTPKGRYLLGEKVAIYKPGMMGYFQDRQIEMIHIFGTRWIPFEQELEGATMNAKGFGLHGAPWINNPQTSELIENREHIGAYDSDGCIRLYSEDMEELFAIIISKPTIVEIVEDVSQAQLSGTEVIIKR